MRVSDERLKQLTDTRDTMPIVQPNEIETIARELRELRESYADLLIDAFHELADGPDEDGWYSTNCTTTNCGYGNELVQLGRYEKHPTFGVGRAQKYRPIRKESP